ncbi:MAG TPA: ribosome silencing factor [Syntrophorhabdaceae bacterium]|nr:ribosome silencing factor [Syntrophorhabdaceae bacterium]HNT67533.1 ribosome silencing factor [Syntrophorhabdaceae bacterium]
MKTIDKATACARLADEKKGKDILVLRLGGLTDITDYFVLASGTSERHIKTVVDSVTKGMKEEGIRPNTIEGYYEGRWAVIDYQSVIVHVFLESLRELYDLESLWIEAERYRLNKENKELEVENEKTRT